MKEEEEERRLLQCLPLVRTSWPNQTSQSRLSSQISLFINNIHPFQERLSGKVHATILKGIVGGFEFSVFQRKFERIGTKGRGNVFARAKGKQQK